MIAALSSLLLGARAQAGPTLVRTLESPVAESIGRAVPTTPWARTFVIGGGLVSSIALFGSVFASVDGGTALPLVGTLVLSPFLFERLGAFLDVRVSLSSSLVGHLLGALTGLFAFFAGEAHFKGDAAFVIGLAGWGFGTAAWIAVDPFAFAVPEGAGGDRPKLGFAF